MGNTPLCVGSSVIMSSIESRVAGAIVGSILADAATLPVHWEYDQDAVAAAVSKHPTPEFLPEMICPFYTLPQGKNSAYGDHAYTLLKSVVESKGFNREAYTAGLVTCFGAGSAFDYERVESPAKGPYLPTTFKKFLANVAAGNEDTGATSSVDLDGVINTAVIVGLYAGDPQLAAKVEEMVKVTQNNPTSINHSQAAAKLLEGFILNGSKTPILKAVEEMKASADPTVAQGLDKVFSVKDMPHNEAAKSLGYSCSMPGNFLSMMHCLINVKPGGSFVESFRPTLMAGGDNCPRAAFIGACIGAQVGLEGLPADLLAKVDRGEEVKSLAQQLAALRS